MGNLSNLYISRSYQSLIHLETDNTASSTLVGLQDGLGNSIGISVNTSGSLSISGSFTSSLANGYAWVGDGNNRTSLVPTSSFGSVTSAITGSSLITASFSGNTLTFTKGNNTTFGVVIPDVSGSGPTDISALNAFTASQYTINTAIGASTSSLNAFTSSVDTKFIAVGSSTASLNSFTSSQNTKNSTLASYTASIDTKFSTIGSQSGSWDNTALNSFTQSQDTKNSTLSGITASLNTSASLAIYTASFSGNTLTFTKGNSTTFSVVLPDVSGSDISSLNAFTQSQETKNSTLASYTASVDTKFSTIGTQSGSWDNTALNSFTQSVDSKFVAVGSSTASLNSFTSSQETKNSTLGVYTASVDQKFSNIGSQSGSWDNTNINAFTQSVDTKFTAVGSSTASLNSFTSSQETKNSTLASYTGSNDTKWSNLGSQSGSFVTESETGSFARTNVDNNFSVNQTFTTITAVSASFTYLQTTFETSSVIYSSGSNQFGDELSDIQTLSGSVKIQGNLTINGTPVQTSSVDISSLNAFTQSQETKNNTLGSYTASVDTKFVAVGSSTASLNSYTSSQDTKNSTLGIYTASVDTKFSTIGTQSGSWDNTALNSFTQSQDTKNSTLASYTASVDTKFTAVGSSTSSLNAYTQSNDTKWSNLASQSGSWVTSAITASSLITASFSGNTLTFTKGSGTTFGVVLPDVSGSDISALNAFTQSQDTKNSTLAIYTASVDTKFNTIGTQSGSWDNTSINSFTQSVDTKFTAVGSSTASLNAYTQSNDTKWSNLASQSGSWVTSAITGSSLITASFSGNTLTFTKGDATTFGIVIPDASGSVIPAGTISGSTQIIELGFQTTASFNAYTQSNDSKVNNLINATGSYAISSSVAAVDAAQQLQINSLIAATGSYITASVDITSLNAFTQSQESKNTTLASVTSSLNSATASLFTSASLGLTTASFSGNTLTFTKGDSSTFGVLLPDVSGSDISALNAFTQSQDTKNTAVGYSTSSLNSFTSSQESKNSTLSTYTASVDTKFSTIGTQSGSWENIPLTSLNAFTQSVDSKFVAVGESTASLNAYTQSNDTKWSTLGGQTGSYVTSAITGSSLVTASFSGNTLTFTKGDSSTFGVIIPDVSGSSISTGSLMTTGSVSGNVLTFTKGDASQFSLTVATGSGGGGSTDTGSLMVTGSVNVNVLTFTKGDGSTFDLTVAASGSSPAGTVSSSQQILNYNIFATTGSNNFVGTQNFSSSVGGNILNIVGPSKMTLGGITMPFNETAFFSMVAGDGNNQGGSLQFQVSNGGAGFVCNDAPSGSTQSVGSTPIGFENKTRSGSISFTNEGNTGQIRLQNNTGSINLQAGNSISISGSSTTIQDVNFIPFSASLNSRILAATGSGGSTDTGSLLVTASFNGNLKEITFTKGDTNQFILGGFATTGSNTFRGNQTIETSSVLTVGSNEEFIKTEFNNFTLQNKTSVFVNYLAPVTQFQSNGNFNFQNTVSSVGSGSMAFLIQNGGSYSTTAEGGGNIGFTTSGSSGGNIGFTTNTGSISSNITNGGSYSATVNGGGNISFTAGTGSISLTTPGEINLQGAVRIKQKDGNNAVTVVNSSGSLLLSAASYTSASLHLSQSSATQNTSVNFVFKSNNNTADTIISGSNNIFTNPTAPTAGFKRYFGGSGNIAMSPASVPQISGSMGFSPTMNVNFFGGASGMIMRGPVSSSAWTISNNLINNNSAYSIGTSATLNAEKIVSGLNMINNAGSVYPAIQAYKTPLSASVVFSTNSGTGQISMNCDSSSISVSANTFGGQTTINNSYFPSTINSQTGVVQVANSNVFGTTIVNASGSDTTFVAVQPRGVYNSIVGGYSTIGLVLNGDNAAVNSSVIVGGGLVVTGSNSKVAAATANADFGSAFFGRWNALDGNRAISGPTVFAVGAGTSTSLRKTAFLIDSGSNTFVEGTLNVSGSTTITGSLNVTSLIVSGSTQFNVGAFNSTITQSGSAAVSQSMTFNNTDITQGVTLNGGGTQLTLTNSGTYNIQFSAQVLAGTGADTIWIWLKKNGTNVSNTATKLVLRNNEADVAAWNFVVPAVGTDYFELVWQSVDGHATLLTEPASGNYPAIPSVIVTVTQVR
jgi:hypothetical protein